MKKQMDRIKYLLLSCIVFLTACHNDTWRDTSPEISSNGIVFNLRYEGFDNMASRTASATSTSYSKVEFCVIDDSGFAVDGIKGLYDPSTSEIRLEGLREGDYRLLLLGIKGDESADGAMFNDIRYIDDEWLSFPSDINKPLAAEYFYSQTPFTVVSTPGAAGNELSVVTNTEIVQKRIVGRTDFSFIFNNPYVETALLSKTLNIEEPRFKTGFTGSGTFTGESNGDDYKLTFSNNTSLLFLPTADGKTLDGEVEIETRNYRGNTVNRSYGFEVQAIVPNRIEYVTTPVIHPDDMSAVAFVTEAAMDINTLKYILQDDEHHSIYADSRQRSFNTAKPLQISVTDDGKLHVRFYSPRELNDVLIQAQIPAISNEFFDIAYFDNIPAFADFYGELPIAVREVFCQTTSGDIIETGPLDVPTIQTATFTASSDDPYWEKLQAIKHGWNISFSLYGGNPELPDGGPISNWMGIRPVHCREAVALFLNFTYMIDMPEHEEILRANVDRLYGNGGVNDKVTVEVVLQQMRQPRTLIVGLVYSGNGVLGLGGGSTFGAYQQAWFEHYFNTYSCEIMFHELGHVMGYNHSSSFTYGPWAQELMNNFYVQHISEMPINSSSYLNSSKNPNKY